MKEGSSEKKTPCTVSSCFPCSSRQEVDRADSGGAEGVCDEAAGRIGGDGQRQEAEGGQGHPLPGSGCVGFTSLQPTTGLNNCKHIDLQLEKYFDACNINNGSFFCTTLKCQYLGNM